MFCSIKYDGTGILQSKCYMTHGMSTNTVLSPSNKTTVSFINILILIFEN